MFEWGWKSIASQLILATLLIAACSSPSISETDETLDSPDGTRIPESITHTLAITDTPAPVLTLNHTLTSVVSPVETSSPVVSIHTGSRHSLALLENGRVLGWGSASILGLSEDRQVAQAVPTLLPFIHDIRLVHADDWYSLFVDRAGQVYELGLFEQGNYSLFPSIDQVQQVATTYDGTRVNPNTILALREDGSLWAWGAGQNGQLGTGALADTTEFVRVPLEDVTQVAFAHSLALAIRTDGTLWVWGRGDEELTATNEIWSTPRQVEEIDNVLSVALGDGISILHTDGSVTVWVEGEFHHIENLPPIVQIDGDDTAYSLGVAGNGTLWVWGSAWTSPAYEDIASIPYARTFGPERFQGHQIELNNVVQVSANGGIILALDTDGAVWAWGAGGLGNLGTGGEDVIRIPTPIIVEK